MFLGLRDIRSAGGRFALIASVVGLITLLIVMLTGLTQGLEARNTAALEALGKDGAKFVFTAPTGEASFSSSEISQEILDKWKDTAGAENVTPLGVNQTRIESNDRADAAAVMGLPVGTQVEGSTATIGEGALVPKSVADKIEINAGDTLNIGGVAVKVDGVVDDTYYSHSSVVWVNSEVWKKESHSPGIATVLLVRGDAQPQDLKNEKVTDLKGAFAALASYKSEQSSLKSMQGFLYAISALVTVSFLTVWTLQRTRDIAVLTALGASKRYLLKDAIGQAAIVLAIGVTAGAAVGAILGLIVSQAVPFEVSVLSVLGPAVGIWLLGLVGSFVAVRNVTKVDPHIALGAAA